MSTIITEECINCGACEPECPNTAIYAAAIEYELDGARKPALSNDFFYIVPEKCTECVGFLDHEACAAACPVDCCIADPNLSETEEALLARARVLHADKSFAEPLPSRFRKQRATSAAEIAPDSSATQAPGASAVQSQAASVAVTTTATAEPARVATTATANAAAAGATTATGVAARPAPSGPNQAGIAAAAAAAASIEKKPAPVAVAPAATKSAADPAPKAADPGAAQAAAPAPAKDESRPADPLADLPVPMLCKNCEREYSVPLRIFSPGANLRCTHCRASQIPTQEHFLLVDRRLRRYAAELEAAHSGKGKAEPSREALQRDLRAVSARLLARPKRSLLGLS